MSAAGQCPYLSLAMTRKYMRSRLLEKATHARTYAPRRVLDVAAEVASRFIASCGGKPGYGGEVPAGASTDVGTPLTPVPSPEAIRTDRYVGQLAAP
jgi:hypothetical protein